MTPLPFIYPLSAALGMWVFLMTTHNYSSSPSAYVFYFVVARGYIVHASLYHSSSRLGLIGTGSSGKGCVQGFSGFGVSVFIIQVSLYTPRFPRAGFGHPLSSAAGRETWTARCVPSSLSFSELAGWWLCTFIGMLWLPRRERIHAGYTGQVALERK